MNITLPDDLATQLSARMQESKEFQTVDEYVCYILREVLAASASSQPAAYTHDQESAVKERLQNLGYLD